MKMSNIGLIISREYSIRVKKKSFILITVLTPVLMALLIIVPALVVLYSGDEVQKVLVYDQTGLAQEYFENSKSTEYEFVDTAVDFEVLKANFNVMDCDVLINVSPLDEEKNARVTTYSSEPLGLEMKQDLALHIEQALRDNKLADYHIENFDEILKSIETNIEINALTITEDGGEKEDSVELYMIVSYILSFLIYIFIFMFGNMVLRGVIEEKTNRIVEVLVSSVNTFELMMGKIIGVALVALTQFAIWIFLTFGIVSVAGGVMGQKMLSGVNEATIAINETGLGASGNDVIIAVTADAAVDENIVGDLMERLSEMHIVFLLICFFVYFLLGYLMYASMFAAVGAAVDNEADTSQLSLPITVPLVIALFIMLHTFQHPSSSLSFWASVIPFTSPLVMLARLPYGVVAGWELALSIGLLVVTFVTTAYLSAKIYKAGILMYGKKATFNDLLKWVKQKN